MESVFSFNSQKHYYLSLLSKCTFLLHCSQPSWCSPQRLSLKRTRARTKRQSPTPIHISQSGPQSRPSHLQLTHALYPHSTIPSPQMQSWTSASPDRNKPVPPTLALISVACWLSSRLSHKFGTQKIDISEDGKSAVAITSFTRTFWTIDVDSPMDAQYFQQYNDTLEEIGVAHQ